jgi:hypothetical protein
MKLLSLSVCLILAVFATSCATVFNRSSKNVAIHSDPQGMSYEVVNRKGVKVASGTAPATLRLPTHSSYMRGESYVFTFKQGNRVVGQKTLDSSISGWYWGNFLIGGVIGMLVIDPLSGSMWTMPSELYMSGVQASVQPAGSLQLITLESVPLEQRTQLISLQ